MAGSCGVPLRSGRAGNVGWPGKIVWPNLGEPQNTLFCPCGSDPTTGTKALRRIAAARRQPRNCALGSLSSQSELFAKSDDDLRRAIHDTCCAVYCTVWSTPFSRIVLHMTRFALDPLRQAVKEDVSALGLRPAATRRGVPLGLLRGVIEGRNLTIDSLLEVARPYGMTVEIGPKARFESLGEDQKRFDRDDSGLRAKLARALGLDRSASEEDILNAVSCLKPTTEMSEDMRSLSRKLDTIASWIEGRNR